MLGIFVVSAHSLGVIIEKNMHKGTICAQLIFVHQRKSEPEIRTFLYFFFVFRNMCFARVLQKL